MLNYLILIILPGILFQTIWLFYKPYSVVTDMSHFQYLFAFKSTLIHAQEILWFPFVYILSVTYLISNQKKLLKAENSELSIVAVFSLMFIVLTFWHPQYYAWLSFGVLYFCLVGLDNAVINKVTLVGCYSLICLLYCTFYWSQTVRNDLLEDVFDKGGINYVFNRLHAVIGINYIQFGNLLRTLIISIASFMGIYLAYVMMKSLNRCDADES